MAAAESRHHTLIALIQWERPTTGWLKVSAELEPLIQWHYPRIRQAAMLLTGIAWDAEDLAQEVFLQPMQSWHGFDTTNRVKPGCMRFFSISTESDKCVDGDQSLPGSPVGTWTQCANPRRT